MGFPLLFKLQINAIYRASSFGIWPIEIDKSFFELIDFFEDIIASINREAFAEIIFGQVAKARLGHMKATSGLSFSCRIHVALD